MNSMKANSSLIMRFCVAVVLCLTVGLLFVGYAVPAIADDSSGQLYSVNSAGESYGSVYELDNTEAGGKGPDLQAATATNGACGYIRVAEGEALLDKMRARANFDNDGLLHERATMLQEAAWDLFGFDALDYDVALDFVCKHNCRELKAAAENDMRENLALNTHCASEDGRVDFNNLSNRVSRALQDEHLGEDAFIDGYEVAPEVVTLVYYLARERTLLTIPVYESDGITIIGEFPINVM